MAVKGLREIWKTKKKKGVEWEYMYLDDKFWL